MGIDVRLPKSLRKGYKAREKRDRILLAVSLEAERRAKLKAPVNHGRLRSSIEGGVDDQGGFVRAQTNYAAFNEFGTMSAGARSDPGPTPPWYQHSGKPGGLEARPFLRPAVHSMRGADIAEIARSNSQD